MNHPDIAKNLQSVLQRIEEYCQRYQRDPASIQLLPVSKTKPISDLQIAYDAGVRSFGENYLQEALSKIEALPNDINWHYIGAIQSNKTKPIAENFSWVHTVSSIKIAERLNRQRPEHLEPLNICIQININNEDNKAGIPINNHSSIQALICHIKNAEKLNLRGFMAIPEATRDFDTQCQNFKKLRRLLDQLNQIFNLKMDVLSMGMSNDLEAAIKEGSTMVRVGTDIFGLRLDQKY